MLANGIQFKTIIYPMISRSNNLKPLVLIVESSDDNREMFRVLLECWGYQTVESKFGENSIEIAAHHCPNLVLMNTSLSDMDGLAALRQMREIDALCGVPVIFISGHAQPEFRKFVLDSGGDELLVKPIDFNQLENVLNKYSAKDNSHLSYGEIIG